MEHDAADELHAVGIKPEHAACGLAHGGEGFGQNVVERFAVGEPRLEFRRLGAQLLVVRARYSSAIASILSTMG